MHADPAAYRAASEAVALADRSGRPRLDILGPDRAKFLHNLTTNEVKRLAVGKGQEAIVTTPQGKTLGYATLLALPDRIVLRTDPGGLERVLPHLQKYGVFDDVTLDEATGSTFELHAAGPAVDRLASALGIEPPAGEYDHAEAVVVGVAIRVVRESPAGRPGLTFLGASADRDAVVAAIREAGGPLGLVDLDPATFEVLRVEAGTPLAARDVGPDNLPQELDRDARAISFVKGCYLGQETVARIDALGHVNKVFRGLLVEGQSPPEPGSEIRAGGKVVGTVTSSASSPGLGRPLALGYIRVAQAAPGTAVAVAVAGAEQAATVAGLPMLPGA